MGYLYDSPYDVLVHRGSNYLPNRYVQNIRAPLGWSLTTVPLLFTCRRSDRDGLPRGILPI
jgi:hypothetical protein